MTKHNRESIKKWRDEYVFPLLKEYSLMSENEIQKKDDMKWLYVVSVVFIISILVVVYLSTNNYFKPSLNQNLSIMPNNTISNSYSFNPQSNNQYDMKLSPNITIVMPNNLCYCQNQTA